MGVTVLIPHQCNLTWGGVGGHNVHKHRDDAVTVTGLPPDLEGYVHASLLLSPHM